VAKFVRLEAAAPLLRVGDRRLAVPCCLGVIASGNDACRDIDDGSPVEPRSRPGGSTGQRAPDGLGHVVHRARRGVQSRRRERPPNRLVDRVGVEGMRPGVELSVHDLYSVDRVALQWMRSDSARRTAGLAWNAPSTVTDSMAARASSGVTSSAMRASPTTWT